ncbi:P-loop NTPase [candidate division KSB1 bacterium]|nr:P-loop NTPase [candidate division KSB1 bacterium]
MNMSEVFVKINNRQLGPLNRREIKNLVVNGEFSQDDLVYHEDSQEWVAANQIDELRPMFSQGQQQQQRRKTVYAIGGGKGGVGKTVLCASLGIGLATYDYQVVVVDADLGGANLHTCMGILEPEYTFYHFYTLQRENLEDICLETPVDNLKLISGACGTLGLANPRFSQKVRFIHQLHQLDADYILLDLGAGSSYNVIDFFLAADEGVLVTTPDPMAIQETFNFLKIAIMRRFVREFRKKPAVLSIIDQYMYSEPGKMQFTMDDIIKDVKEIDDEASFFIENYLANYHPRLILNMVHSGKEIREGDSFRTAAHDILNVDVDYMGFVEFDESVRKSVKELKPFVLNNPRSKASKSLAKLIAIGMLKKSGWAGLKEKRQVLQNFRAESVDYPDANLQESDTICSVNCFYWGDCDYQQGGFPCPIRNLDPIFKRHG